MCWSVCSKRKQKNRETDNRETIRKIWDRWANNDVMKLWSPIKGSPSESPLLCPMSFSVLACVSPEEWTRTHSPVSRSNMSHACNCRTPGIIGCGPSPPPFGSSTFSPFCSPSLLPYELPDCLYHLCSPGGHGNPQSLTHATPFLNFACVVVPQSQILTLQGQCLPQ